MSPTEEKAAKDSKGQSQKLISPRYFQGHQCHAPAEQLPTYSVQCSRWRKVLLDIATVHTSDMRARKNFRSHAAFCAEKYRQYKYYPLALHPFSKLRLWLEILFVVSITFCYTIMPIYYSVPGVDTTIHDYFWYMTDGFTILNICANLLTGYVEGSLYQQVELDPKRVVWKYLRTWFLLDFLSVTSYVPYLFDLNNNVTGQFILLTMKLLRAPVLYKYISNINDALDTSICLRTYIEVVLSVYLYLMGNVYFQYAIEYIAEQSFAPMNPRDCSWITLVGMLRKNSNLNNMVDKCSTDIFYMVSWTIAKLLVFHCGLKHVIAVYGAESAASKYFRLERQVEMYMQQRKLPPRIKQKIHKFYAIRYQSTFFVEERILLCMTGQLREDIIMHSGRQLVREYSFMKHLPRSMLLQISFQLKLVIFIAGDIIFKINSLGDCLYFIDKGTVAVYSESGKEVCHLKDGDYFGEIALVMRRRLRTASVIAVSNCELFRLDRADFNESIACFPTVYEHIKEVATNRYEHTRVLDERHKTEIQILNNYKKEQTASSDSDKINNITAPV